MGERASRALNVLPNAVPGARFPHRAVSYCGKMPGADSAIESKASFSLCLKDTTGAGFWLAVEAVSSSEGVALLGKISCGWRSSRDVAPSGARLKGLSDWRGGCNCEWCPPEVHFALADAALSFPLRGFLTRRDRSGFDGLPPLLTPHHGSEMILEDKVTAGLFRSIRQGCQHPC